MLDEWKEYKIYTSRPCREKLFSYEQFRNGQSGMLKILTCVARGFIAKYMPREPGEGGDWTERTERCTTRCLKAWCGLCECASRDVYYRLCGKPEKMKWERSPGGEAGEGKVYAEIGASCLGRLHIELPESAPGDPAAKARFINGFKREHPLVFGDNVCADYENCSASAAGRKRHDFISGLRGFLPEYILTMFICPLLPEGSRELVRRPASESADWSEQPEDGPGGKKRSVADKINSIARRCGYEDIASREELDALGKAALNRLESAANEFWSFFYRKKQAYLRPEMNKEYDCENGLNSITYARVLALALDRGEPRRYRLCCTLDAEQLKTGGIVYTVKNNSEGDKRYLYDLSEIEPAKKLRDKILGSLRHITDTVSVSKKKTAGALYNRAYRYFRNSGIDKKNADSPKDGRPRVCANLLTGILDSNLKNNVELPAILGRETGSLRRLMKKADKMFLRSYPPELSEVVYSNGSQLKKSDQQIVLKALCCYFLSRGDRDAVSVPVIKSELLLWTQVTDKTAKLKKFRLSAAGGGTEPLFCVEHYAGNMIKLSVNRRWLDKYDWRLSDADCKRAGGAGGRVTVEYTDRGYSAWFMRSERKQAGADK